MKTKLERILIVLLCIGAAFIFIPSGVYTQEKWVIYMHYTNTISDSSIVNSDATQIRKNFVKSGKENLENATVFIQSANLFGVELSFKNPQTRNEVLDLIAKAIEETNTDFILEVSKIKEFYQTKIDESLAEITLIESALSADALWINEDYIKLQSTLYNAKMNLLIIDQAGQSFDSNYRVISIIKVPRPDYTGVFISLDLVILGLLVYLKTRVKHD